MKSLLLMITFLVSTISFAGNDMPPSKEVFLKGSIDGKSLFMVLGFDKAKEINSKIFKSTFSKENIVELGSLINNSAHDNDFVGEIGEGADITKKHFTKIISSPWRSLSKIPRRFKVNLQKANERYYTSNTPGLGAVEYAATGVWAVLESSYYLVIESPVALAGNLIITSLAIPFKITVQIGRVVLKALKNVLFPIGGAIAIAGVTTYTFLSTGIVELGLVINKQLGFIGYGLKYVFSDLPRQLSYPVSIEKLLNIDLKYQTEVFKILKERVFLNGILDQEIISQEIEVKKENKFKTIFYAMVKTPAGMIKAYKVTSMAKRKKVQLTVSMTRKYFNFLKDKTELKKADFKEEIRNSLSHFIIDIESMI